MARTEPFDSKNFWMPAAEPKVPTSENAESGMSKPGLNAPSIGPAASTGKLDGNISTASSPAAKILVIFFIWFIYKLELPSPASGRGAGGEGFCSIGGPKAITSISAWGKTLTLRKA